MKTPYHIPNTTHWIQCANDHLFCPVFPGDTRITSIYVRELPLEDMIPKRIIIPILEKEAPDFLAELLNLEIPESQDRLMIPVIETSDKVRIQEYHESPLQAFIRQECVAAAGYSIKYSEFHEKFIRSLEPEIAADWGKHKVGKELPHTILKGRSTKHSSAVHLGNVAWKDEDISESRVSMFLSKQGTLS